MFRRALATLLLVVLPTILPAGDPIEVPGEFATIQAAIDAALPGETVLVGPGTYVENIDFLGKAITVRSSDGPAVTTIDGNQNGSVVVFDSGEGLDSVIEGFLITNGTGTLAEGSLHGGGIHCFDASPTIQKNWITGNSAELGGGISCREDAHALIIDNLIELNTSGSNGGGVSCFSSDPTLLNNQVIDNTGGGGGGVTVVFGQGVTMINNLVSGNQADLGGGVFILFGDNTLFVNNTVVGNSALDTGGGMWIGRTAMGAEKSIMWGNSAGSSPDVHDDGPIPTMMSHCLIAGGWGGPGQAIIDADPLFVAGPDGDFYLSQLAAGQPSDSPAVDAGPPGLPIVEGTTRTDEVLDSEPADLGYHYPVEIVGPQFVRGDCSGDGTLTVVDAVVLQNHLFLSFPAPPCMDACDFTDNGIVNIADVIQILLYLFVQGAPPAEPVLGCGPDPTPGDGVECLTFTPCF